MGTLRFPSHELMVKIHRLSLFDSLAISAALHLAAFVVIDQLGARWAARNMPAMEGQRPEDSRAQPLQVELVSGQRTATRSPPAPLATTKKEPTGKPRDAATAPRFLMPPDWTNLAQITRHAGFEARIRIHVTAAGLARSVEVIDSSPISEDVLEEIRLVLYRARYSPAMRDQHSTAGHLDIVLGAELQDAQKTIDTPGQAGRISSTAAARKN